jgi:effector-binding domain-containing protein
LIYWRESNGYAIAGPIREIYLRGHEADSDSGEYVSEVQSPLKKN